MESLGAMFPAAWPLARGSVLVAAFVVVALVPGCIEGQPPFFTAEFPPRFPHPEHDPAPFIDRNYAPPNDPSDGSPYGVHLSWREDPRTTMTVTWFTRGQTDVRPAVLWGSHPDDLDWYVAGASRQVFGVNAQAHEVTIRGLNPAQLFYYRVTGTTGESATYATRTAPEHGTPFHFAFFADHGTELASVDVTGAMLEARPAFLVLAGDVAYADGDQAVWDTYFHIHEPLFARVPLMAAPGNHEFKDGIFYDAYRTRFSLPNEGLWYGFDFGNIRFTVVEFYHRSAGLSQLTAQLDFFREELRETEARKAAGELDFHAVVQHYPFYTNHIRRGHYYYNINLQEDLVLRHRVDLMLVGHEHYYERSHPMANGYPTVVGTNHYVDPRGYIQVTSGGAGRNFSEMAPRHLIESWQATGALRYSYVEMYVEGNTIHSWAVTADGTGDIIDYFILERSAS